MQRWLIQSGFMDPGPHAARLAVVGPAPEDAAAAVQGLLVHGEALQLYGARPGRFSRDTLAVKARLAEILAVDGRPLDVERPLQDRALGTCRDYALLMCAAMRQHRRPARVRCGFASYLAPGTWQDHWICEAWSGNRWRRLDAQMDGVTREALGIGFAPCDVPTEAFLTADEAWRACRAGRIDPADAGHDQARGLWFVYVNLARDRLALGDEITSAWDGWRAAASAPPTLGPDVLELGDRLAQGAPSEPPSIAPWWLPGPPPGPIPWPRGR
jgi:hypothetical protein